MKFGFRLLHLRLGNTKKEPDANRQPACGTATGVVFSLDASLILTHREREGETWHEGLKPLKITGGTVNYVDATRKNSLIWK